MIPDTFDAAIKVAWVRYLPSDDWRYLKAQWWCESGAWWATGAKCVSSTGAIGLCQLEPDTFTECADECGFPKEASPFDPNWSALAGTYYMRKMWHTWRDPRHTLTDRRKLAQASYNAGQGRIIRAQELANGAMDYDTIIAQLPRVTGESNARETTGYVAAIETAYRGLTGQAAGAGSAGNAQRPSLRCHLAGKPCCRPNTRRRCSTIATTGQSSRSA